MLIGHLGTMATTVLLDTMEQDSRNEVNITVECGDGSTLYHHFIFEIDINLKHLKLGCPFK